MSRVSTEVAMVCVGPSRLVIIIFVASIFDVGTAIVLDAPSGLLPTKLSQRLYAPLGQVDGFDRFFGPTAELSGQGTSRLDSSHVGMIGSSREV